MKHSVRKGFSFGLTSGIITTLGMIVGLDSSTHNPIVVLGGILAIAIADAFSDALGIHISEESEEEHTDREIWEATVSTFFSKFFFSLTFVIPILILDLKTAIIVSIIWGLSMIALLSYYMTRREGAIKTQSVVFEHLFIAVVVIFITHFVGGFISMLS